MSVPLPGACSASKAAAEALGTTARPELSPTGARAGVAYFAELDNDTTARGFDTAAAPVLTGCRGNGVRGTVTPLPQAVDALETGLARRSACIVVPAGSPR